MRHFRQYHLATLLALFVPAIAPFAKGQGSLVRAPIQDLGGQVFNVKAYGALGNGTGDDSTAINSAESACYNSSASTGTAGTVYLPPGVYQVDGILILQTACYMKGAGRSNTIVKASASLAATSDVIESYNYGGTGCVLGTYTSCPWDFGVSDLIVDGNKANRTGTASGNDVSIRGNRYLIEDADFINAPNDGIYSEMEGAINTPPYVGYGSSINYGNAATLDTVRLAYNGNDGLETYGPPDSQHIKVISFDNSHYGSLYGCVDSGAVCAANNYITDGHNFHNGNYGYEILTPVQGNNIQSENNTGGGGIHIDVPGSPAGNNWGELMASQVQAWNNTGPGVQIDSPTTAYTTFAGNILTGLDSHENTTWGIVGSSGATKTVLVNPILATNTSGGISWSASDSRIINLLSKGNSDNACDFTSASLNSVFFEATCEGSTTSSSTDLVFPSSVNTTTFNVVANAGSGTSCLSGTPTSNLVGQISVSGAGTNCSLNYTLLPSALPVSQGGTGTTTPGLIAGSNVGVTGTWPNQTISATGASPPTCADTSGSATAQSCTLSAGATLGTNTCFAYTTTTSNTGSLTIAVNGGSAITVHKWLGTNLGSGDMPANKSEQVCYDGTYLNVMTVGNAPTGSGNTTSTSLTTNTVPVANGANSIVNSLLTDNGTNASYNGNQLTVLGGGSTCQSVAVGTSSQTITSSSATPITNLTFTLPATNSFYVWNATIYYEQTGGTSDGINIYFENTTAATLGSLSGEGQGQGSGTAYYSYALVGVTTAAAHLVWAQNSVPSTSTFYPVTLSGRINYPGATQGSTTFRLDAAVNGSSGTPSVTIHKDSTLTICLATN